MVKTVLIDNNANKTLKSILSSTSQPTPTGLLIGTMDSGGNHSTDYVLSIISTSPITDQQEQEQVDYDWIINHAMQVHDMLVGGMDILGVYCVDLSPSVGKQILVKLFKKLNEFEYYKQMKFNQERLLFLVDTKTKVINTQSLDLNDSKSSYNSCELTTKENLFNDEFFKLNSNINLKSTFKTPNVKSHQLLKEDFYAALSTESMLTDENKYVCLINNSMVEEDKTFSEFKSTIDKQETSTHEYNAVLMENLSSEKKIDQNNEGNNLDSIYELTGVCNLVVLFHKSMSFKTIKRLLIYDAMRSLYARVRLLVDDLDARKDIIGDGQAVDPNSNDVSAIEEAYQTPNRIHIIIDSNYLICDYVFPDENDSDICERVKELFNYEINDPSTQLVYMEDLPPEIKRQTPDDEIATDRNESSSGSNSKRGSIASPNDSFDRSTLSMIAMLVALIAFILAGYYSFKNEVASL